MITNTLLKLTDQSVNVSMVTTNASLVSLTEHLLMHSIGYHGNIHLVVCNNI